MTELRKDLLCVAALIALTAGIYWPLVRGIAPYSTDHNYHLYKVIETEALLARGRLFGWSDAEFAGYPHNVLYPFAGYLVVAAIDALPGISLERAYAWTLFCTWLAAVLSVFLAARLHLSRSAGIAAALFALFDPGGWWVGGHHFVMKVGIWLPTVAGALTLVALAIAPGAVARGRVGGRGGLAMTGALVGLGILFHPLALILAIAAFIPLVIALLASEPATPPKRVGWGILWLLVGAAAASAFWLVPLIRARRFNSDFPFWPPGSAEVWNQILDGKIFHQPAIWVGVTLCGLLLLATRRDVFSRFTVLFVPSAILLTTSEALVRLGLFEPSQQSLVHVLQVQRIYFLIRPLAFIAAGYAIVTLAPPAVAFFRGSGWRVNLVRGFSAGVLAVTLSLPGFHFPGMPSERVPQDLDVGDRAQLERALDAAEPLVPTGNRLALYAGTFDHCLVGPLATRGIKMEKMGTIASTMFKTQFWHQDHDKFWSERPELMARLGATAILSRGSPPPPYRDYPLVGVFGLFQLRRMDPLPRAWIDGPGEVRVVSWEDERIRLEVRGAAPDSRLRLALGYYDAWRETSGLPVERFDYRGSDLASLPAVDGERVLAYRPPLAEWLGIAASLAAAAAAVAAHLYERKRSAGVV